MKYKILLLLFLPLFLLTPRIYASCDVDVINRVVKQSLPKIVFDEVRSAPIRGLCEALIGTEVFYVSEKGDFLFVGNLVSVASGDNLTVRRRNSIVKNIVAAQDEKQMVVLGPENAKKTITVFTDVDCPYCAKFHREVPQLTRNGVKVRYLLYPRNGPQSSTYRKSVSVWCAKDRVKAIGIAKAGGKVETRTCDNPVAEHYRLGVRLGIDGTPTLILEDGSRIGGYVPASRLLAILGIEANKAATARRGAN